mmetsp:Transcript_3607/g.13919  ORF Transcript_3607/g.13919 Transcript_3607/m.13919 type:complete len:209 (-) Transcript_3607:792-1418(-)
MPNSNSPAAPRRRYDQSLDSSTTTPTMGRTMPKSNLHPSQMRASPLESTTFTPSISPPSSNASCCCRTTPTIVAMPSCPSFAPSSGSAKRMNFVFAHTALLSASSHPLPSFSAASSVSDVVVRLARSVVVPVTSLSRAAFETSRVQRCRSKHSRRHPRARTARRRARRRRRRELDKKVHDRRRLEIAVPRARTRAMTRPRAKDAPWTL